MTTQNSSLPNPTPAPEQTAATYVEQQLVAAERRLKNTRLTTTVVVVLVIGYSVGVTAWMHHNVFEPRSAADIATAHAVEMVQSGGAALSDEIVQEVPAAVASLPDMVLNQMPQYRLQLEDRFEHSLADYGHEFEPEVETFLTQFVSENRESLETMLAAAQDPKLTKHFGDQFENELLSYLKTPNERGESAMNMLEQGQSALQDVQMRLHRLAHANDLTPEELKLRRLIAATMKATDTKL
jgi:hypothetical protein